MMMKPNENNDNTQNAKTPGVMSAMDFARLGDGQVAYVKQIDNTLARDLFPGLSGVPEGINLYVLAGADGTPLGLSDSRDSAIASAWEHDLEPVSVH